MNGVVATFRAFVASVPPLATVIFERWATRTGRLQIDVLAHR